MSDGWTTTAPTRPGWYWRRVMPAPVVQRERNEFEIDYRVSMLADDFPMPKHVEVVRVWIVYPSHGYRGLVTPALRCSPPFRETKYGETVEWSGPITEPEGSMLTIKAAERDGGC